jgi:hypothetical protein
MDAAIESWTKVRRLALVGASRTGKGFGALALKELRARGLEVRPVHPGAGAVNGVACAKRLADLAGQVEGVLVCVPPAQGEAVLREAAAAGIPRVWLQQGAESPALLGLAKELGLEAVGGKCLLMHAGPVRGFHGFHRGLVKLFGKL